MIVIGHRGANRQALENTWDSFQQAIKAGCQRIEFDVRITSDENLIVMHDSSTHRTSNLDLKTRDLTSLDLKSIRLKNGEPIPLLPEVLKKLAAKIELNIEIKSPGKKCVSQVIKLANKQRRNKDIIISTFNPATFRILGRYPGNYRPALLWDKSAKSLQKMNQVKKIMNECKADIFHPHVSLVNRNVMNLCREQNWSVYPYIGVTEENKNPRKIWHKMKHFGVDGLCTNFPKELAYWLKEN